MCAGAEFSVAYDFNLEMYKHIIRKIVNIY